MTNSGRSNFWTCLNFLPSLTFLTLTVFLTFTDRAFPAGYGLPSRYIRNAYLLNGKIDLIFDKKWSSVAEADRQRFTQSYKLGLDGFVIDKRLISFDLDGSFSQEINDPGDTIDNRSFSASINLLNETPRGFLRNFPQPINLRYSSRVRAGDSREQSYGVSFTYRPNENPLFRGLIERREKEKRMKKLLLETRKKKEEEEEESEEEEPAEKKAPVVQPEGGGPPPVAESRGTGNNLAFPTFSLDYDKYNYELFNLVKTETDRFDLRAMSSSKNVDLNAEYTYNNFGGSVNSKFQDIDLNANLHHFDEKMATRLEVLNRATLRDYNSVRTLNLRNVTTWQEQIGKNRIDSIVLQGEGDYFRFDFTENYDIGASGIYKKVFSKKLRDEVTVHFDQGRSDNGYLVNAFAGNNLNYLLSKTFTVTNNVLLGQTELGSNFAAGLGLGANLRPVNVWTKYDFSNTALDEGRTNSHRLELSIRGRMSRDLSFSTRNFYHISDVAGSEPFRERGYELQGDLYWNISVFSINVGASDVARHKSASESAGVIVASISGPVDFWARSLYSNISVYLSRNMFLTLSSTYTKDSAGFSTTDVHSLLSWNIRQVILNAEYEIMRQSGFVSRTDQRVFVRLTRTFERLLRVGR